MKKLTKKHLIFALVVAILVTAMAFGASAVDADSIYCPSCGKTVSAVIGETVEAQCDSDGYTNLVCPVHDINIGTTNTIPALGHLRESAGYTLSADEKYYQHNLVCSREGCKYTEIEHNEGNVIKYCKVNFNNNFVAVKFESDAFCPYAKLAAVDEVGAYKTETETVYVAYPEGEDVANVSASTTPFRMADKNFGQYIFAGWLDETAINEINGAVTADAFDDTHDIMSAHTFDNVTGALIYTNKTYHDTLVDKAKLSTPATITTSTPAEYNLFAIFEVNTDLEHSVKFYNYDGSLLYKVDVNHAIETAEYKGTIPPRRPDNVEYTYSFGYWELYGTTTKLSTGYDIDAVYGDLKVMAYYNPKIRQYDFKYFQKDGETPFTYYDESQDTYIEAEDTVTIAGFDDERLNADAGVQIEVPSYFDSAYDYVHTGKWLIPSRGNYVVDLENITLPYGTLDNEEVDYIALIPQYQQYKRMYKLVVNIVYAEDGNYHPKNVKLQVTNNAGQVIGYAEVDQSEKYYKDGTYTVVFDVEYSESYKVAATATGYAGTATTTFKTFDPAERDDDTPGNIVLQMNVVEGEPCSCICHTVFKPVWVGILNLLNSLFKLEFVCCDDMFANIGGSLHYGPSVS